MPPEAARARLIRSSQPRRKQMLDNDTDGPPLTSLRLHMLCVVLSLVAAGIFTLTEHDNDHEHTVWCVFEISMQTLLVIVATAYFRMRVALLHQSSVIMPMLVVAACLSLICEPIQRLLFGTGHAFEMLIMHSQCNLMLALAVCGFRMTFQRLATMIAVFMTIFCCTISNAAGLIPLTVLFAVASLAWLVASWWETVDRRMLKTEQAALPKTWFAVAASLPVLVMFAASGFGANTVTMALQGFMPSSRGTGQYDPFSRGGVGDGDALVAGNENIKSFAPLEDAPFIDSDKPSLYDVFNDTYDEPFKRVKRTQRAISLPPELLKHVHQMMAEAKQAGREFSLLRGETAKDKKRIRDLSTHALFYVAGRTPLHLKTEVFELFDGVKWMPASSEPLGHLKVERTEERHWLNIPQPGKGFDFFSGTVTHSIKVANLDGRVVPSPAHPVGICIDKVDQADFYHVFSNGLISLDRASIPSMTPINFVSRCVDRSRLHDSSQMSFVLKSGARRANDLCISLPASDEVERIGLLAEQITDGVPRGWTQIEAVTQHLRNNYVVDRDTKVSPDARSPVAEFLFETRRGPEYLFASSAAVMLRSLGYSTRLVGGFYARPDKYDQRKRHTVVHSADAHIWCEVALGAGAWLTVEPSPGYEILSPPPGLFDRLMSVVRSIWQRAVENVLLLFALAAILTVAVARRKSLQNTLLTLRWKLTSRRARGRRAVQLAMLVDHRLRLAGLARVPGTTLSRWSRQNVLAPYRHDLTRVAEIADREMFGGDHGPGIDDGELDQLEAVLSYQHLKRLRKPAPQSADTSQAI